jgi:hypothetical protein
MYVMPMSQLMYTWWNVIFFKFNALKFRKASNVNALKRIIINDRFFNGKQLPKFRESLRTKFWWRNFSKLTSLSRFLYFESKQDRCSVTNSQILAPTCELYISNNAANIKTVRYYLLFRMARFHRKNFMTALDVL